MRFNFLLYMFFASLSSLLSSVKIEQDQNDFIQTLVSNYEAEENRLEKYIFPKTVEELVEQIEQLPSSCFVLNIQKLIEEKNNFCSTPEKIVLVEAVLVLLSNYLPHRNDRGGVLSLLKEHITFLFDLHKTITQDEKEKMVWCQAKVLAHIVTWQRMVIPFFFEIDETQKSKVISLIKKEIDGSSGISIYFHALLGAAHMFPLLGQRDSLN